MFRRLLPTFLLAFALGVASAVLFSRRGAVETAALVPAVADKADAAPPGPDPANKDEDDDNEASTWPDDAGSPEEVMYAQPQHMQDALDRLTPRIPERVNLYLIGFAGDGGENVFRNEVEYVERLFDQRFDAAGHTLLLINNPGTLKNVPLASLTNLETAVDAIAEKMDRDGDILLLYLASHGSRDHVLYVGMDPLPLDQISPEDLADVLADAHIRNKVIVISACYSGGFIDALKDDDTMLITAARGDRASFGCGTDADITDFGRAFLVEGLNHNESFRGAFGEASKLIDAWETRDSEEHSFPQFVGTPHIESRLRAWRNGIHLGPPVPFVAPVKPNPDNTLTAAR
jgi:hypothetical protein